MAEIDMFIEGLAPAAEDDTDPGDALPEPSSCPVTQSGDLWSLGEHRVLCGNALLRPCYQALLQKRSANAIFADPPYNVHISGHVCGKGKIQHREFAMAVGEMNESEFTDFLTAVLRLNAEFSQNGSVHYICMDWRHLAELSAAGKAAYSRMVNLCVWAKSNAGMGSFYRSQHELIFVFENGSTSHRNNIQLGRFGRSRTNVWNYPGINSFARATEEGDLLALHPTVKPVALVADAILDCTARGDIVLDPFLGSGTTLIAAERTGRQCRGMELDPIYVDTAVRRWQAFTNSSAIHDGSGQTFSQREQEAVNVGS